MQGIFKLTNNANSVFSDAALMKERNRLEKSLMLKDKDFDKGEVFERPWYPNERKFRKTKLGVLHQCTMSGREEGAICRVMNYDRISSY